MQKEFSHIQLQRDLYASCFLFVAFVWQTFICQVAMERGIVKGVEKSV